MKKSTTNKFVYQLLGILLFIVLWQVLSMLVAETTFIFPSPYLSFKQALSMLKDDYIYRCIAQTMIRMLLGFVISLFFAFIFGTLAGNFEKVEILLKPTISVFRSVPTASLVYLFLVIAGARMTPLYIVVLVSFPILYESVLGGIKATPLKVLEASRIDGTDFFRLNSKIRIPLATPYIMVGIASSFGLALKIEIMAEVITGYTRLGLGSAILAAQRSDPSNMVPVFGYSLVVIVLILIIDSISQALKTKYQK